MGRGRGKGKKQKQEEIGSGEEERVPAHRRRGRPQKSVKDEVNEVEIPDKVEENGENMNGNISNNEMKTQLASENKRKRKRSVQVKEKTDITAKEENGIRAKSSSDDLTKTVGFRQNGSRRKNKPRRAAEVGVDCK